MDNRYLFRGKRIDNGEWIEGYYTELTTPSVGLAFLSDGEAAEAEDTVPCIVKHRSRQSSYHSPGNPVCVIEQDIFVVDPATIAPVRVPVSIGENGNVYCPCCKSKIGILRGLKYCSHCGQALDWTKEHP